MSAALRGPRGFSGRESLLRELTVPARGHRRDAIRLPSGAEGPRSAAVCIPARDEEATVGGIVGVIVEDLVARAGLVDEVVVVDDGSRDRTAEVAAAAGARVICIAPSGKGQALRAAVSETSQELLVFVDADLQSFRSRHVVDLLGPLIEDEHVMLVKAGYERWLHGVRGEGGRVTELLARPLLQLYWPELARLSQPLSGECALRRRALDGVALADGYAIELGLLLDIADRFGPQSIAEVHLGRRTHRNRPLRELAGQATVILSEAVRRLEQRQREAADPTPV